jgi:signal transduction histidine kinase
MKKHLYYFSKKTLLKYLLIMLTLLLIAVFFVNFCQKKTVVKQKPDHTEEIKRLTDKADTFYDTNKLDSAYIYFNKIQLLCDPKTNYIDYVYALSCMGEIQQSFGNYTISESLLTKTLPHLHKIKKTKYAWFVYNLQGLNYLYRSDYHNALIYFKKTLHLKTTLWRKSYALGNIAITYMEQYKYKEAIDLLILLTKYKKISDNNLLINDPQQATLWDNLGLCYYKLKNNEKALDCYKKSLKIRLQIKEDHLISLGYIHLSTVYQKINPQLAKKYAKLGYQKALEFNNFPHKISSLSELIESSQGYELKKYSLIYINLIDSVNKAKQMTKNEFANIKYHFNKEKEENLQLTAEKAENELYLEKQKNQNIISYILIALSLSLIVVLYFYLTSRGNREKIEATYKSETRIAKKLHDELANDIYHTMAFAENKNLALSENKEQLLTNLDAIYLRTRDISKENSPIITSEEYTFYLKEMISRFNTSNTNLLLNDIESILWSEIEKNKKITVYRVLQELLVNMKKHSNATLVGINFKKTEKNVVINYTDNGKGIDINNMIFKNGLHNVENRILSIKGEIDIDTEPNKGFKVFIKFPL